MFRGGREKPAHPLGRLLPMRRQTHVKARIIEQGSKVYSQQDLYSTPLTELAQGSEVELGGVKTKAGKAWVSVTLPNGEKGYLTGDTRVFHLKPATLVQNSVNVYAQPSAQSMVRATFRKNAKFLLTETVKQDATAWVKVRDAAGNEGFIEGSTRIKVIPEVTKAVGQRNMLVGALWCIGGTVVTVVTYNIASSSPSGGTYFVAWGAIIFGGIQFLKGVFQALSNSA
jgi:hypothetical protein